MGLFGGLRRAWLLEIFHRVPRVPEKLLAFPLSDIKVALWLRQVEREREGKAAFE